MCENFISLVHDHALAGCLHHPYLSIHHCLDLTASHLIPKHFILNPKISKHTNCCIDTTYYQITCILILFCIKLSTIHSENYIKCAICHIDTTRIWFQFAYWQPKLVFNLLHFQTLYTIVSGSGHLQTPPKIYLV